MKNTLRGNALWTFASVAQARDHLAEVLRPGDLVLLKASERADKFDPICSLANDPDPTARVVPATASGPPEAAETQVPEARVLHQHAQGIEETAPEICEILAGSHRMMCIVGLGNPEAEFRQTPHNIGHRALDELARFFGIGWTSYRDALVAATSWNGAKLCLVKPMVRVNQTGAVLRAMANDFRFGPEECILVHDDMDLPLGAVRVRAKGSDGGHRGVRSALQAFGSASIVRVKIGVGRPAEQDGAAKYVLSPFSMEDQTIVNRACAEVAGDVIPREVMKWLYSQRVASQ